MEVRAESSTTWRGLQNKGRVVLRYEGTRPSEERPRVQVEGEVRIENLGAWPRTGLLPE